MADFLSKFWTLRHDRVLYLVTCLIGTLINAPKLQTCFLYVVCGRKEKLTDIPILVCLWIVTKMNFVIVLDLWPDRQVEC